MNKDNSHPEDQHFDVFRYVAGEMSAEEETQFETRLGENEELREQVANMVCTLSAADRSFADRQLATPASDRNMKRPVHRLFVSAAALLLLASLAVTLMPKQNATEPNPESVAIAWAESVEADEFEFPEEDFEFASLEFGDDDWIGDVVVAANEESQIN